MQQRNLRRRQLHQQVSKKRRIRRNVFFITEQVRFLPLGTR
ncbi:MAG: hypothetical protein R3Y10_13445 [Ferrimonas sp.]